MAKRLLVALPFLLAGAIISVELFDRPYSLVASGLFGMCVSAFQLLRGPR